MHANVSRALFCALSFYASATFADTALWQDIQARATATEPLQQRLLTLDENQLQTLLNNAGTDAAELSLPLPQGGFTRVRLIPVEILAPDVAARHPELQTWRVEGLDGKVSSGRAERTALGFTAMLLMANGDTLFIDPTAATPEASQRNYRSLSKRANAGLFKQDFQCGTHSSTPPLAENAGANRTVAAKAGETLHTYDIAIAATSEYTQFHGGNPTTALGAITTTLNRINEIYQRDLSIKLRLVSGTETVFANASTDPFQTGSDMLSTNQVVLDTTVGNANYDIGHVFSTGDGGIAVVEAACNRNYKAQGMSGWDSPTGDIFAIDFVAHELGHQFGATHTFNSTKGSCAGGSRIAATAYEPGSGSTIMAYAGICSTDNLQPSSDAMFHAGSISQITRYAHDNGGASCATSTSLNNINPTANAGIDYTIPARTPFILSGSATDSNGDTLSYSWEQMNTGTASSVDIDAGSNALIRTQLPSAVPSRTIPRLSDLVTGIHTYGETLPSTSRALNFRLQVRDGKGGIGHDDMLVSVYNTGSAFAVTAPKGNSLTAGSLLDVAWNVANTDRAPISCDKVDIAINSTGADTGFQTLLSGTANDGAATVTLPTTLGTRNNIRVKCSNNIFFALSDANASSGGTDTGGGNTGGSTTGGGGSFPVGLLALLGLSAWVRQRFTRTGEKA